MLNAIISFIFLEFFSGEIKKSNSSFVKLWDDVVANPQNWVDNRMDKQNGLVIG